jgi:hypothetical protein
VPGHDFGLEGTVAVSGNADAERAVARPGGLAGVAVFAVVLLAGFAVLVFAVQGTSSSASSRPLTASPRMSCRANIIAALRKRISERWRKQAKAVMPVAEGWQGSPETARGMSCHLAISLAERLPMPPRKRAGWRVRWAPDWGASPHGSGQTRKKGLIAIAR